VASGEDLNMHHVVLLLAHLFVVVDARVKNKVSWPELFEGEVNGQSVELVGLVPAIQLKSKVVSEIVNDLSDQGAAVQIQRCVEMLLSFFPVPSSIRHSEVFLRRLHKLTPQVFFEVWVCAVQQ
jgi:hypothetical protein